MEELEIEVDKRNVINGVKVRAKKDTTSSIWLQMS